jgi:hypothetical protein
MPLSVANSGVSSTNLTAGSYMMDVSLTSAQSAQIEQILSELQSGVISPTEARAQISSIVTTPAQQSSGTQRSQGSQLQTYGSSATSDPFTSYYEMPLPQETLPKGPVVSYNAYGAATQTIWSASHSLNASA